MMTFLFFQNFDWPDCWGKNAKNGPKGRKTLSLSVHISGAVPHMIVVFGTQVQNDDIFNNFFIFSKFSFWGFLEGRGQKITHNYQFQSITPYISRFVVHTIKIFGTQV